MKPVSSISNVPLIICHGLKYYRYLLNASLDTEEHCAWFKFLGILFGVAVRTKKPLDLHLAPCIWKLIAGMPLKVDDLEEVGSNISLLFALTLFCVDI